jgi:hypothetical protein
MVAFLKELGRDIPLHAIKSAVDRLQSPQLEETMASLEPLLPAEEC